MTNTKFRKRALLSSVAMLLVALVALGSATFAWFTSLPTANASGLHLKATAAKGLVIMTGSAIETAGANKSTATDWLHTDYLNSNDARSATKAANASGGTITLDAASCSQTDTVAFYQTTAAKDEEPDAIASAEVSTITPSSAANVANNGVYKEKIWMKQTGGDGSATPVKLTSVTVSTPTTATAIQPAFRMALVYNDGTTSKFIGEYAISAGTTTHITAVNTTTNTYTNATKSDKSFTAFPTSEVSLGDVDATGNCYLDVYLYLDGEDSACFTNNVKADEVITNVALNFTV